MADEKDPKELVIGTSSDRVLVKIGPDGSLTYGPDYTPDEAAKAFWEAMAARRKDYEERLLFFAHVERLLARMGEQDLRTEQMRITALSKDATPVDKFNAERALGQLEVLVHEVLELSRGVALRDRENRKDEDEGSPPTPPKHLLN